MLSQSTRFSIGGSSSPSTPIKSLSYATLPTSPGRENKREIQDNSGSLSTSGAARHVFIPQKDDTVNHRFRLRYSPCSDTYFKEWDDFIVSRGNIRNWQKGVYSFESIERIVDAKKNLVYFERTSGSNTGILTWKIDFRACGLVIDEVSLKVNSHNTVGGEVLVMLSSNETKKTISHMEGLGVVRMKGFENCDNLILSIHLIGETAEQKTRLFETNILSRSEYPLDLKITLKPPVQMYNKPIILLGVMFSNSQETLVDRRHYRSHSSSSGRGFLHLNIVQGKHISSGNDTAPPDAQVKCCLLPDDKSIKSCKTSRAKKSISPVWDEFFLIDGISQSQLRKKQLGVRVVNWQLGINRKNKRLGEVRIASSQEMFDFLSLPSPTTALGQEEHNMPGTTAAQDQNDRKVSESGMIGSSPSYQTEDDVFDWNGNKSAVEGNVPGKLLNNNNDNGVEKSNGDCCDDIGAQNRNEETATSSVERAGTLQEEEGSACRVKPRRPPLPERLKLTGILTPPNNRRQSEKTPESPRKATTPTLARLMPKLSMSPRPHRDRRSSWGGESELSLHSPRSLPSPRGPDQDNAGPAESCQWDFMISRPKEWVYSWHALKLDASE